jgi:hypothetical protein
VRTAFGIGSAGTAAVPQPAPVEPPPPASPAPEPVEPAVPASGETESAEPQEPREDA